METTVFEKFTEMDALWNEFKANHTIFAEKGNKAAAGRARKSIQSLEKLITGYKQSNTEHVKASK